MSMSNVAVASLACGATSARHISVAVLCVHDQHSSDNGSSGSLQIQRLVAASIENPDVIDGHFK
jgi:hypothetical protein